VRPSLTSKRRCHPPRGQELPVKFIRGKLSSCSTGPNLHLSNNFHGVPQKVPTTDFDERWSRNSFRQRVAENLTEDSSMNNLQRLLDVRGTSAKLFRICPNCSSYAIAVASSEDVSRRCVRLWSCEVCGCEFETCANAPANEPRKLS